MSMTQAPTCAWCLSEQGEQAQEDESHGICEDHATALLMNWRANRQASQPVWVITQAEFEQNVE